MSLHYESDVEDIRRVKVNCASNKRQGVLWFPKDWIGKDVVVVIESKEIS
jgi:hypothetical protein